MQLFEFLKTYSKCMKANCMKSMFHLIVYYTSFLYSTYSLNSNFCSESMSCHLDRLTHSFSIWDKFLIEMRKRFLSGAVHLILYLTLLPRKCQFFLNSWLWYLFLCYCNNSVILKIINDMRQQLNTEINKYLIQFLCPRDLGRKAN